MATINIDNDNVFSMRLTLEEARNLTEAHEEEITTRIDEAQGHVHMKRDAIAYVIIAITG